MTSGQDRLVAAVNLYDEDYGNLSDDLREHDVKDLMDKFDLDENQGGMLYLIIREDTDPDYCAYGLPDQHGNVFLETVQESIHQSYEGRWSDYDKVVIRSYLADITLATYMTKRDPNRVIL